VDLNSEGGTVDQAAYPAENGRPESQNSKTERNRLMERASPYTSADDEASWRPAKLAERLSRRIVEDIVNQGLEPGSKLPRESEMLAAYGVGRSSLRESLRILEVQGVISMKTGPTGGPTVRALSGRHLARTLSLYFLMGGAKVSDLTAARLTLEPWMAGLAASNGSEPERKELKAIITDVTQAVVDDDESWVAMSGRFHDLVLHMSGSPIIEPITKALAMINLQRARGQMYPRNDRLRVHALHREIGARILARDSAGAERLMRTHLQEYADLVTASHPLWPTSLIEWI
jgi:GntR family transcriptional regulator, transcriptional repressor for pyruvate dehydrogenase complex